ncbi:hypothetical protein [Hyphomicrobium sp. CS1GBMeth3]|uniref:sodium:solute symporter family transporter n=1 Tax=Hyphomicrobium sp. CS1GBMeth3 TaxID=1892845 RepID=UPI00093013DD|nr:hypothetical protein [Hyphomicrobium sp. CS1GBMeth3]
MSDATLGTKAVATRPAATALVGLSAAGRALPVAILAALPGLVFTAGFDHLAYGLGPLAGIVLAGLLIAPHIARVGAASIPEALLTSFGKAAAVAGGIVLVLVALPLLTAELATIGIVAEASLGLPYLPAIVVAAVLSIAASVLLSNRAFAWLAAVAFVMFLAGLLLPLVLLASKSHGLVLPHLAYGDALSAVDRLEQELIENGLVEFETFAVHVTPFLRLSRLDTFALVVSLALGVAVLPQLASALASNGRRAATVRLAGAWSALFVMLVLVTVPALAAYAKLEIYGAMAANTPLATLPVWLEAPLGAGLAHIHGTSIAMLDHVAKAVSAGQIDPAAIADSLAAHALAMEQRWLALDEQVRSAIIEAARALGAGASSADLWQAYVGQVLPAAAAAAGNNTATLTQAALVLEPLGLLIALPALSGAPAWILLGFLLPALVIAAALARSLIAVALSGRTREPVSEGRPLRAYALTLIIPLAAAGFAALRPDELVSITVSALSLGAAGLFPVLALGLAWKRATAAGAIAAILLGGGVTLYYDFGIEVFPAAFYRTWAPLSNAGEFAIEEFETLTTEARDAESEEARASAEAALETLARGTPSSGGLANWFGIDSASGAVFGVPAGFAALVLVSLVTRRRSDQP